MTQNRPLFAVLLASVVLAVGILALASLRPGTGPDDVAIRVDGVEVTFAEYELRVAEAIATRGVSERLVAGEDFGMPAEAVEQMQRVRSIFGPLQPDLDEEAVSPSASSRRLPPTPPPSRRERLPRRLRSLSARSSWRGWTRWCSRETSRCSPSPARCTRRRSRPWVRSAIARNTCRSELGMGSRAIS